MQKMYLLAQSIGIYWYAKGKLTTYVRIHEALYFTKRGIDWSEYKSNETRSKTKN